MILQAAMDNTIEQLSEAQQNQGLADETANTQIDTLILDNRKKLNEIIGEKPMRYLIIFNKHIPVRFHLTGLPAQGGRCHIRAGIAHTSG
jgi:hypothetical protein